MEKLRRSWNDEKKTFFKMAEEETHGKKKRFENSNFVSLLNLRQCAGLELSKELIGCAVSIHHRLAQKDKLTIQDLYGEKLMLMAVENWRYVHPLLKILPVDWGVCHFLWTLHSPNPSPLVEQFLEAVKQATA